MTARAPALVVLNPSAHGGAGARRFEIVRKALEASFEASTVTGGPDGAWRSVVDTALRRGVRVFIVAGGDGTAHSVLNTIVGTKERPPLESLTLGAVGLGSSNDLLKPFCRRIDGIPVRLDIAGAAPRDIIGCTYVDASGWHRTCVLVSASLGVAACANARFGDSTATARLLRRVSTAGAIAWAAARTVATWQDIAAVVRIDGGAPMRVAMSNLSVLKTEWLSGPLRMGRPIAPASGDFDVALAQARGRTGLLVDILALLRGQFDGRPGHLRTRARSLGVRLEHEFPLEFDGEVVNAHEVQFDMFPERIRLCA